MNLAQRFVLALAVAVVAGVTTLTLMFGTDDVSIVKAQQWTFTIHGTLTINDYDCSGLGYSDLQPGAQVEIISNDNQVLGVGYLESEGGCERSFTVRDVPTGEPRYGARISDRGVIWQSEAEARNGYTLTIG